MPLRIRKEIQEMLREIQVDYKFIFIVLHVLQAAIHKYTMIAL